MLDWQTRKALREILGKSYPGHTVINLKELEVILDSVMSRLRDEDTGRTSKRRIFKEFVQYLFYRNLNNYDSMLLITGDKGKGKSSFALMLAREWCRCINRYMLEKHNMKTNVRFNPKRNMAYTNVQVMNAIEKLDKFEVLVCDEAIDFASAQNWNKRENKELKIKFGKIRTKHLFFILCWPWKINKLDKVYFESNINYWCDLYERGEGAVFVKDMNPYNDPWKIDLFKDIGNFNEFTPKYDKERIYSRHPNFWSMITANKPSAEFYKKYLAVREANVYNNKSAMDSLDSNDIIRAFMINSLEEVFMKGATKGYKRFQKHLSETYGFNVTEKEIKEIFIDAKNLVDKKLEEIKK